MRNKSKGFTLIELIIVIAIIAILAAIALPRFGEVKKNATINADIANANTIAETTAWLLAEGKIITEYDYIDSSGNFRKNNLFVGQTDGDSGILSSYLTPIPKGEYFKGGTFAVQIEQDASVIVWLYKTEGGSNCAQIYPRPPKGSTYYDVDGSTQLPNPYALTE